MLRLSHLVAILLSFRSLTSYITGSIGADEQVVFFPTNGRYVNFTTTDATTALPQLCYELPIHGWIFEPECQSKKRRVFLAVLRKALNITNGSNKEILKRRTQPFLVDNERWKQPRVRLMTDDGIVSKQSYVMPRSGKNGHFRDVLVVPVNQRNASNQGDQTVVVETVADDGRRFQGKVHMLDQTGVSVISDIDDTIKMSNVSSTKALLRNTFLETFKPVPGMAQVFSLWKREKGASFHFVSSSPWQLYEALQEFCRWEGFPDASFHLKTVRPKDKSILNLFKDPLVTKTEQITSIMDRFPERQFILVGDSGEKDPEVYGEVARLYDQQVLSIFIRQVGEHDDSRLARAFSGVHPDKWTLFTDPKRLQLPCSYRTD